MIKLGKCFVCVIDFNTLFDLHDHRLTKKHKENSKRNLIALEKGKKTFELY